MNFANKYYEFYDNKINPRVLYDIFTVVYGVRKLGLLHIPIDSHKFIQDQLNDFKLFEIARKYLVVSKDKFSRESLLKDAVKIDESTHIEIWFSLYKNIDENPFKNPGKSLKYPECCIKTYETNSGLSFFYNNYLFSNETRHFVLNRLVVLFNKDLLMPDFFPCSLSCKSSIKFIEDCHSVVLDKFPRDIVENVKKIMQVPLLLWGDNLIYIPNWELITNDLYLHINQDVKYQKIENICKISENNLKLIKDKSPKLLKFNHLLNIENLVIIFSDNSQQVFKIKYI
jgi:hypothetical protein